MVRLHRSANDNLTADDVRSAGAVVSTGDILTTEAVASTGDIATDEVVSIEDSGSAGELVSVALGERSAAGCKEANSYVAAEAGACAAGSMIQSPCFGVG
jgi:hypothetical protein